MVAEPVELLPPLKLRCNSQADTIGIDTDEIALDLIDNHNYVFRFSVRAAGHLLIMAYEATAAYHPKKQDNGPLWEFLIVGTPWGTTGGSSSKGRSRYTQPNGARFGCMPRCTTTLCSTCQANPAFSRRATRSGFSGTSSKPTRRWPRQCLRSALAGRMVAAAGASATEDVPVVCCVAEDPLWRIFDDTERDR
jgi:hypothetical protein